MEEQSTITGRSKQQWSEKRGNQEEEDLSRSKKTRRSEGSPIYPRADSHGEGGGEGTAGGADASSSSLTASPRRADQDRLLLARRKKSKGFFSAEPLEGSDAQLLDMTEEETEQWKRMRKRHEEFVSWRQRQCAQHMLYLNGDLHRWADAAFDRFADAMQEKGNLQSAGAAVPARLLALTEGSYAAYGREYCRRARAITDWFSPSPGETLTFGFGDSGQLGCTDAVMEAARPRRVRYLAGQNVVAVAGGGLHSMALTLEGDVYAWGPNDDGAVGNFYDDYAYVPRLVEGFRPHAATASGNDAAAAARQEDEEIMAIASGDAHNLCLSRSGKLYFFGVYKDKDGQRFRHVPPPDEREDFFQKLCKDQQDSDSPVRYEEAPKFMQKWPAHLYGMPAGKRVLAMDCGFSFNVALVVDQSPDDAPRHSPDMEADSILTWGIDICGELGRGNLSPLRREDKTYDLNVVCDEYLKPLPVQWAPEPPPAVKKKIVAVSAGGNHFLALVSANGNERSFAVYSTGLNNGGQLGHGDTENRNVLTRIAALDGCCIQQLAAGAYHSLCLDNTGRKLYAFGRGDSGQLGTKSENCSQWYHESLPTPVLLDLSEEKDSELVKKTQTKNAVAPFVVQIACGHNHSLLRTNTGSLYTWGYGDLNAVGHGTDKDVTIPTRVQFGKKNEKTAATSVFVKSVAGGGQHSIVVASVSKQE